MDKGLAGQVGHSRGHLSTVAQEGVVINCSAVGTLRGSFPLEIVQQIPLE